MEVANTMYYNTFSLKHLEDALYELSASKLDFGDRYFIIKTGERGAALAGRNEHGRKALPDVVVAGRGGGAVGGGDVEGGATQRCRCTQADGEDGVGGAAVAFGDADIVDVQCGKSDRRLTLVDTDVDDRRGAGTGIGHIRVIPGARVQV